MNYRLVVIDCPISLFGDPVVGTLLGKVFQIKYASYSEVHDPGVIPVDKVDFFGTHLILCQQEEGELKPLFAYRSVTWDRCLKHRHDFPASTVAQMDANADVNSAVMSLMEKCQGHPEHISWDSGWAQDPSVRVGKTPEQKEEFREITMAIGTLHHREMNIPHMTTLGTIKVKTDVFFSAMGLRPLVASAPFAYSGQFGSQVELYHGTEFSKKAYECADKYQWLWENRIQYNGAELIKKKAA